jgi:dihydropteroate synthase
MNYWQTSKRKLSLDKTLIMGIINATPDSFFDGGKYLAIDNALRQAEKLISEGANILDIGGESSRPKSQIVSAEDEISRVAPLIQEIEKRFDIPISIDTWKSSVAKAAIEVGAEIINDISGLRFDENVARVANESKCGLVLMHLRGTFETMHSLPAVDDVFAEVTSGFNWSLNKAKVFEIADECIALDVGIGFGKTFEQNLSLISNLDRICAEFSKFPILSGTSRKSFIGRIIENTNADERLGGSISSASIAVWNGAKIVRVHDVKDTVQAIKVVEALLSSRV